MYDFWRAFGRGVIKLVIGLLAGFGVGLLVLGLAARDEPGFWQRREPPPELFVGIGAGLLTSAGLLLILFLIPWLFRKQSITQEPKRQD